MNLDLFSMPIQRLAQASKKSAAFRQEKRASWNCGAWCGPTWSASDFQLEPWVPKKLRLGGWAVPKLMSQTPVWDSQLMTLTSAWLNLYTWKYMNMFLTSFLAQLPTGFAATVETPMASITAGSRSHECFVKPQFSNQFSLLKSCLKYAVP